MLNNPSTPKILRGAFVAFYPKSSQPRTIVFQINPESIKRNLLPPQPKKKFSELKGVRERISFVLSVDENMGDDYFVKNEEGISYGVLPFLSAIELLVYPAVVSNDDVSTSSGSLGFISRIFRKVNNMVSIFRKNRNNALPFVSLLFGAQRIIPVKIQSIKIIEQAFDSTLQPIRASVKIEMDALTEQESNRHPTIKEMYKNYQSLKVILANSNNHPGF